MNNSNAKFWTLALLPYAMCVVLGVALIWQAWKTRQAVNTAVVFAAQVEKATRVAESATSNTVRVVKLYSDSVRDYSDLAKRHELVCNLLTEELMESARRLKMPPTSPPRYIVMQSVTNTFPNLDPNSNAVIEPRGSEVEPRRIRYPDGSVFQWQMLPSPSTNSTRKDGK